MQQFVHHMNDSHGSMNWISITLCLYFSIFLIHTSAKTYILSLLSVSLNFSKVVIEFFKNMSPNYFINLR